MPDRFCAICGKPLSKKAPHFAMCLDCYLEENPLFELPQKFSFKVCPDCGKYSKHEKWIDSDSLDIFEIIRQAIYRFLLSSIIEKRNIDFSIEFDEDSLQYTQGDLIRDIDVKILGKSEEKSNFKTKQTINVEVKYELCKICSNLRTGEHFESIIQLRVDNTERFDIIEDVIQDIHKYTVKQFKSDRRQYIAKMIDQKYGVDLFLSTNELMNHIISFLKDRYNFILKRSKKLVGRDNQRGKNIYRLKTLIKFLPFKNGNILSINNDEYRVLRILKNKVILRRADGDKVSKSYSYFFQNPYYIKSE
ncbi:MAG: NMD3 family protein [Promethearchaeota archaeon]|nr:MAG: NMD3 family protein [Candidatus Lokiarchaeota archaeon]